MAMIHTNECKTIKDELNTYLEQLKTDTTAVKTSIESFYDIPKDKIDGADFNKVKAHLKSYSVLFESIQSKIDELNVAQGNANDKMEAACNERSSYIYVQGYRYVDNEKQLEFVESRIAMLQTQIEETETAISNYSWCSACSGGGGQCVSGCQAGYDALVSKLNNLKELKRKYVATRNYINRLFNEDDKAAYEEFNTAITALKTDIDTQNDKIKEMTIKASVKDAIISGNLDLNSVRDSAVNNGLDYDSGYYDEFNNYSSDGTSTVKGKDVISYVPKEKGDTNSLSGMIETAWTNTLNYLASKTGVGSINSDNAENNHKF